MTASLPASTCRPVMLGLQMSSLPVLVELWGKDRRGVGTARVGYSRDAPLHLPPAFTVHSTSRALESTAQPRLVVAGVHDAIRPTVIRVALVLSSALGAT